MSKKTDRLRDDLQRVMLKNGARLTSLDDPQNWLQTRNNNHEGETNQAPVGENIMPRASEHTAPSNTNTNDDVAPAGGKTDADIANKIAEALARPGATVRVETSKPYGRIFLESAIPTAAIVGGIVAGVAVLTVIDNKWGVGSRVNKLIEKGVFDNNPGLEMGPEGTTLTSG
jgi:hypothetical protein